MKRYYFPLFLPLCGIWTLKVGPLSVASFSFILFGLLNFGFSKRNYLVYVGFAALIFSAFLTFEESEHTAFQYSIYFPVISLLFIYAWTRWVVVVEKYHHSKLIPLSCYISIILALGAVAVLTPAALYSAIDGQVGLFNEKGIIGQYLAVLSVILFFQRGNSQRLLANFLLVSIILYNVVVLQSGRAVFYYVAAAFLYFGVCKFRLKLKHTLLIIVLVAFIATVGYEFIEIQIDKLFLLLLASDDLVGRYAAAFLVRESNISAFKISFC